MEGDLLQETMENCQDFICKICKKVRGVAKQWMHVESMCTAWQSKLQIIGMKICGVGANWLQIYMWGNVTKAEQVTPKITIAVSLNILIT